MSPFCLIVIELRQWEFIVSATSTDLEPVFNFWDYFNCSGPLTPFIWIEIILN